MPGAIKFLHSIALGIIESNTEVPTLKQLATIDLSVRPSEHERIFRYRIRLCYVYAQGCAYADLSESLGDYNDSVGTTVSDIVGFDSHTQIAMLDAILGGKPLSPTKTIELIGDIGDRARIRAMFIADEITNSGSSGGSKTVLIIGAVFEIYHALLARGCSVFMTDLSVGVDDALSVNGALYPATDNARLVGISTDVLVTAMTLANGSFDAIADQCRTAGVRLWLFAETGAHAAPHLVPSFAHGVFSEPFPFYVFGSGAHLHLYLQS